MDQKLDKLYLSGMLPSLDEQRFHLLEGLCAADWERQTIALKWKHRNC